MVPGTILGVSLELIAEIIDQPLKHWLSAYFTVSRINILQITIFGRDVSHFSLKRGHEPLTFISIESPMSRQRST